MIAGNLAGLALSIPMHPAPTQGNSNGIVDASTLFATQILQRDMQTNDDAGGDGAAVYREKK